MVHVAVASRLRRLVEVGVVTLTQSSEGGESSAAEKRMKDKLQHCKTMSHFCGVLSIVTSMCFLLT